MQEIEYKWEGHPDEQEVWESLLPSAPEIEIEKEYERSGFSFERVEKDCEIWSLKIHISHWEEYWNWEKVEYRRRNSLWEYICRILIPKQIVAVIAARDSDNDRMLNYPMKYFRRRIEEG